MDVLMPQLGETVLEGTVTTWYKNVGDTVAKGELLLDVETDKAATEIEAPAGGVVSSINVQAGDTVDVGAIVAIITVEGEVEEVAQGTAPAAEADASPSAAPVSSAPAATSGGLPARSTNNRLSPAVRRLVKEHELDIGMIPGTGRAGRITKRDVVLFLESSHASTRPVARSAAAAVPQAAAVSPENIIPFDRFRRVTAEHMVMSKATSAHVLQAIDADFSSIDACRLSKKESWKNEKGYSLTYLPFVARAVCQALAEFPRLNSSCLLYTSPSPRDLSTSRMPSSA